MVAAQKTLAAEQRLEPILGTGPPLAEMHLAALEAAPMTVRSLVGMGRQSVTATRHLSLLAHRYSFPCWMGTMTSMVQ